MIWWWRLPQLAPTQPQTHSPPRRERNIPEEKSLIRPPLIVSPSSPLGGKAWGTTWQFIHTRLLCLLIVRTRIRRVRSSRRIQWCSDTLRHRPLTDIIPGCRRRKWVYNFRKTCPAIPTIFTSLCRFLWRKG